jgi:hypothetical protein
MTIRCLQRFRIFFEYEFNSDLTFVNLKFTPISQHLEVIEIIFLQEQIFPAVIFKMTMNDILIYDYTLFAADENIFRI